MAKVGIIGHGVVGSGVADILLNNADVLTERAGEKIELARVCDLRRFDVEYKDLFTTDAQQIYADPEIDIVVECMGGKGAAYRFVKAALENGKHVVTSNKELIADCGTELEAIAEQMGVCLRYEASCGGGIPVIKPIEEDLGANRLTRVAGILNGTTNYILTRMREGGVSFEAALHEAQEKGYAEADPSADVLGWDARRKICILAHVAFGTPLDDSEIKSEGIDRLTREDMLYARELGRAVKLLGMAEQMEDGWRASVAPAMLPDSHPLACVNDVFNAVMVHGDRVDDVMFYGRGAGTAPTASAVCGDVLDIVRNPAKKRDRAQNHALEAKPSYTRELRLFMRVQHAMTQDARAKVEEFFPDARLVQLDGEAFADEFALVTEMGQEDVLLRCADALSEALPCGAPIRYLSL